jgi:hypothetical protein
MYILSSNKKEKAKVQAKRLVTLSFSAFYIHM